MEFDITTFDQLQAFIDAVTSQLSGPTILALQGELGSGKTTFTKHLLKNLGVEDVVSSPTFTLMHQYMTPSDTLIYHLDLYRLKNKKELQQLGLDELFESSSLVIIEWPEIASHLLPAHTWWLQFQLDPNDKRMVFLKNE